MVTAELVGEIFRVVQSCRLFTSGLAVIRPQSSSRWPFYDGLSPTPELPDAGRLPSILGRLSIRAVQDNNVYRNVLHRPHLQAELFLQRLMQ